MYILETWFQKISLLYISSPFLLIIFNFLLLKIHGIFDVPTLFIYTLCFEFLFKRIHEKELPDK